MGEGRGSGVTAWKPTTLSGEVTTAEIIAVPVAPKPSTTFTSRVNVPTFVYGWSRANVPLIASKGRGEAPEPSP